MHCLAFHPDGSVETRRDICNCDECFEGMFSKCLLQGDENDVDGDEDNDCDVHDDTDDDDDNDYDDDNDDDDNDMSEIDITDVVFSGLIIALRTPVHVPENFYLVCVNNVSIAAKDIFDSYQHLITKGMQYIECQYLAIDEERKKRKEKGFIRYKKLSREVFVLPGEILSPFVEISDDLKLSQEEQQWLDDCA